MVRISSADTRRLHGSSGTGRTGHPGAGADMTPDNADRNLHDPVFRNWSGKSHFEPAIRFEIHKKIKQSFFTIYHASRKNQLPFPVYRRIGLKIGGAVLL
ncbi:hypothetical protein [Victivallis lenta]|uniref:hypothetical protein n=1 Tax=Victivallis lenta TaxID=2606640 RepID=UPI003AF3080E